MSNNIQTITGEHGEVAHGRLGCYGRSDQRRGSAGSLAR